MFEHTQRGRIEALQAALDAFTESLEHATSWAEWLVVDAERHCRIRHEAAERREEATQLVERIAVLREEIGLRLRTLERLRARMRLLRGAARDKVH
jgi:hypothetical protein